MLFTILRRYGAGALVLLLFLGLLSVDLAVLPTPLVAATAEGNAESEAAGSAAAGEEPAPEEDAAGEEAAQGRVGEREAAPDQPAGDESAQEEAAETGEAEGEENAGEPEDVALRVQAIAIRGNRQVPVEAIMEALKATQVGQPLRLEDIQEDLRNIYSLGYFADVRADAFETEGGVRVVFEVVENPVVREVRVTSADLDPQTIRGWMETQEGQVLNSVVLDADLQRVQDRALEEYSLYLRPASVDVSDDGVVSVEFRAARVAEVRITGNEKTKDHVIRREITFGPGDLLKRSEINRSLDRLQRLGFFQDVRVQGHDTADPDYVAVEFAVTERMTGSAAFGAGYSSQDGFLGYVEVSDRNFLGRGQGVNVRAEFGQRRTTYDLGFYEPYLFGTTTSFGINVYRRTFDRVFRHDDDYREQRTGGDLSVGWPLGEYTRGTVRFRAENLVIEPLEGSSVEPSTRDPRTIRFSIRTDTTDHWLNPLRGFRSLVAAEVGGRWLGGDVEFTKYEAEYSRYFKVGSKGQAVAIRALGGIGVGDIEEAAEQFRVGGTETLRGYSYGELVGDRMAVFNAEYRFPITENVQGVVFADVGEAWYAEDGPDRLRLGYGVGARLDTPIGVLRLDYGIGEDGGRLHFQIGPSF